MTGHGPTVSVVVPAHDRPELLREAIRSARLQTHPCLEIIVVDDCSTADIASALAEFGPAVRLLRQPVNRGANAARNAGVRAARGDFVAFLDDDDTWRADKIACQLAAIDGREACLCGQERSDGRRRVHRISEITATMLLPGNPFCGMSGLLACRAALLEEPLDEDLPSGQDWDIYVRLAKRRPIAYVPEPLVVWRHGGHEGITLAAKAATPQALAARAKVIEKHRAWLGERRYRARLAGHILRYVSRRPSMIRYFVYSCRVAGVGPTMRYLVTRAFGTERQVRWSRR